MTNSAALDIYKILFDHGPEIEKRLKDASNRQMVPPRDSPDFQDYRNFMDIYGTRNIGRKNGTQVQRDYRRLVQICGLVGIVV